MDAGIIVAIVIASLNGLGLIITLVVLILKGGFQQGRLFNRVEALEARVEGLEARVEGLASQVQTLGAQVQTLGVQVQTLGVQVQSLTAQVAALATVVGGLQAEVQQTNRVVTALANHTHDVDGNTVFQMPPAAGR